MKIKKPKTGAIQKRLQKRIKEVGAVRDAIRSDIEEFSALKYDCEEAINEMERAAEALSRLA